MKINKTAVLSLRNAQSWSQEDLAAAAGVSVRTIQRMESQGVSSINTVKSVAAAFNIDHREICTFGPKAYELSLRDGIDLLTWGDVFYLSRPFWKYMLIGIGIFVLSLFILLNKDYSEVAAAYWAGAIFSTLIWMSIIEIYQLYQKKIQNKMIE